MQNQGTKGAWPRSRGLLLNFGPLYISGMAEATTLKFVAQFPFIKLNVMWAISLFPAAFILDLNVTAKFFMDHSVYSMCA